MATLKKNNIVSSESLINRQKGKAIIYVEGESDLRIFQNFWFVEYLDKVSFSVVKETQGCAAVVKKVGSDRNNGVNAFGLIDRDKLMADNHWGLLQEVDDNIFEGARPYKEIKVTVRWELESYLVDPVIFEKYLCTAEGGRAPRGVDAVELDFLKHADSLIPLAALNQTLHRHRLKAVGDGFAKLDDRVTVDSRIRATQIAGNTSLQNDYENAIPLIEAFSGSELLSASERLNGLLRTLNGKSMLDRLAKSAKLQYNFTYFLARDIKQAGRVPLELTKFVESCAM